MAAYNAGEGKILKALHKTKTDDYWALLNTAYIKRETKNYVPKFIAASLIASSPEEFGFTDLEYHPPLNYDTVTVESPLDIEVIAECAETSVEDIRDLNPELRRWCTPPDVAEYELRIPAGTRELFIENLSQISEERRLSVDSYQVKKGDSLKRIARKKGVPVEVIRDLNAAQDLQTLRAGITISLPPQAKFVPDRDDKASLRMASHKRKKTGSVRKGSRKISKKEVCKHKKKVLETAAYRKI